MLWVLLFVGIALAGLATVVCFAVWLWRKALALMDEVGAVADQAGELMDLLGQVELAEPGHAHDDVTVEDEWPGTVRT